MDNNNNGRNELTLENYESINKRNLTTRKYGNINKDLVRIAQGNIIRREK